MINFSRSSTHINRPWHQLGKDLLLYLKWAEYSYMWHSHTGLNEKAWVVVFYTSQLHLHLEVVGCCIFAHWLQNNNNNKTHKPTSEHSDRQSCLNLTWKWKYLRPPCGFDSATTPWISVKITLHILWGCTSWACHILWVCRLWYLQFRREDTIKKPQDPGWPLLMYVHKRRHTFMLAWFIIEIVITVVREGNYTEDFRI